MRSIGRHFVLRIFILVLLALPALAANAPTLSLAVDASEAPRKIFHARVRIAASPGTVTLYYPKWIPGEHAPTGPIDDLAGLKFSASGKALKWRRDLLDGWAIHVELPPGENEILADLDYLAPASLRGGYSSGSSVTDKLAIVSWNQVLLYPKGWKSDEIMVSASLKIPDGWKYATPLPLSNAAGNDLHFAQVTLTTLIDSAPLSFRWGRRMRSAARWSGAA